MSLLEENGFTIVTREHKTRSLVDPGDAPIAAFVFTADQVILRTDAGSIDALKTMPENPKTVVLEAMAALFDKLTEMIR
jgi:hypothetical protein